MIRIPFSKLMAHSTYASQDLQTDQAVTSHLHYVGGYFQAPYHSYNRWHTSGRPARISKLHHILENDELGISESAVAEKTTNRY